MGSTLGPLAPCGSLCLSHGLRFALWWRSGRAMIVSVPKSDCAVTQDEEWGCPRCFWRLRGIEKAFWPKCLQAALDADSPGGAYRVEFLSNTELFPFKPAAYCQREHYTVCFRPSNRRPCRCCARPKTLPLLRSARTLMVSGSLSGGAGRHS